MEMMVRRFLAHPDAEVERERFKVPREVPAEF